MDKLIDELRLLRETKDGLKKKEQALCRPTMDLRKAMWLKEQIADRDTYLLVALCLFSPRVFMGYRMKRMVRRELAHCLNTNKEYVSTLVKTVLFRYKSIKSFHREANKVYENILQIAKDTKN